jgi:hypothetical protein
MLHTIIVFIHIASAMGIIAGVGIEGIGLAQLRHAGAGEGIGRSLGTLRQARRVAGPSVGLTILSGLYLAGAYWGWKQGWVDVSIASIAVIAVIDGTMTGRVLARVGKAIPNAPDAGALATLRTSYLLRIGVLAGIVFLMTNKLAAWPSVLTILIAMAIALVADFATSRRRREAVTEHTASR